MLWRVVELLLGCDRWATPSPDRASARKRLRRSFSIESLEPRQLLSASLPAKSQLFSASVIRLATPRILNGTPTSDFSSVVLLGDTSQNYGSGTLIAPQWVLTAAHCSQGLGDTDGRVTIGGVTYTTERIVVHSRYNPSRFNSDRAFDIALWKLSEPVQGVDPSPIYREKPQAGQLLTLVGYGRGGTIRGETDDPGDEFGVKRVGTTPLERVTSTRIRWVFNQPTESNTGHGDSGGPAFIKVGSVYYVAGVTSGGTKFNAGRGDRAFDTRVDVFQNWIDSTINGNQGNLRPAAERRLLRLAARANSGAAQRDAVMATIGQHL